MWPTFQSTQQRQRNAMLSILPFAGNQSARKDGAEEMILMSADGRRSENAVSTSACGQCRRGGVVGQGRGAADDKTEQQQQQPAAHNRYTPQATGTCPGCG